MSDKQVSVTWNVAMWIIGIVFIAGGFVATFSMRTYVDEQDRKVTNELVEIKVQLAVLTTEIKSLNTALNVKQEQNGKRNK